MEDKIRTESLRFRCTPEEKDAIRYWAEQDARTISSFVRAAALDKVHQLQMKKGMGELFEFVAKNQGMAEVLGDGALPQVPRDFRGSRDER